LLVVHRAARLVARRAAPPTLLVTRRAAPRRLPCWSHTAPRRPTQGGQRVACNARLRLDERRWEPTPLWHISTAVIGSGMLG
jgi:hypothetical protein